ncbi:MAG: RbsD/FucU family protein [Chloroflexota bacterium]
MLKSMLIHPQILSTLAASGHGGKVLIADGNYPFVTRANPHAPRVYLNLAPGKLNVTDVLDAILTSIPVEAAHVMLTDNGSQPGIYPDFEARLTVPLTPLKRDDFYGMAYDKDMALVIATGGKRLYANIILTIGVVS